MPYPVRQPAVAGTFYHAVPDSLRNDLRELFSGIKARQDCTGVVSPHAGYMYSGRAAAEAISCLKPAKTFVILGPNHTLLGPEFSIMGRGAWKTPLGDCRIDEELARKLKRNRILQEDSLAHVHEHSIEVQLPFLQFRFKRFSFVPIAISNTSYSEAFLGRCKSVGETIAGLPDISIIASSDFSHYMPSGEAKKQDMKTINYIKKPDIGGFFRTLERNDASVCGFGPIAVLMSAMKKTRKGGRLIAYTNSGEATKDYDSVVAYAAIGFG